MKRVVLILSAVMTAMLSSCGGDDSDVLIENIEIGDFIGGGIVFWIDSSGQHGLVCSVKDQPVGRWLRKQTSDYNTKNMITKSLVGKTSRDLGTGFSNTDIITSAVGGLSNAAAMARDYNGGGFSDWYLPSFEELRIMYFSQDLIDASSIKNGGSPFAMKWYWSSSHCINSGTFWGPEDGALAFNFEEQRYFCLSGASKRGIRAIRNF